MNLKRYKVEIDNSNPLLEKSIEEVSKFVKNQLNNQKYDIKTRSKEQIGDHVEHSKEPLDYRSNEQRDEVKKTIKEQPKTQIKQPIKLQMSKEQKKIFGNKKRKNQIQKVAYPPHKQVLPLKGTKNIEFMTVFEEKSKKLINRMMKRYTLDQGAYLAGMPAFHKIAYLSQIQRKLSNAYIRQKFMEHGGILIMQKWLDTHQFGGAIYEPSITVKLGLFKILKSMHLTPSQINSGQIIMKILAKNKQSQLFQLRELAKDLLDEWQYSIMNMNKEDSTRK